MIIGEMVPLVTILGAAIAPTIAAIWAGRNSNKNRESLHEIHILVNNQLSEAVERLNFAKAEIEELKKMVKQLSHTVSDEK